MKAMTPRRAARAATTGLCAAALALLGACGNRNEYHPPPPPPVTVSKPVRGPVTEYLLATGSVAAAQTVDLVALDDALNALAQLDSRQSQVVELRAKNEFLLVAGEDVTKTAQIPE